MKKIFILVGLLLLCTGCMRIDNKNNYNDIISMVVSNPKKANKTSIGYTYYLPLGVETVKDNDYNQKLKTENIDMYLYVDIVSYYYKNTLNFDEVISTNAFYYQKINFNNKTGYVKIDKLEDDNYFIKIVYNYAKIETYTSSSQINKILTNSMIILDSINYNDNLIKEIVENDNYGDKEKEYKIKKPEDAVSKFSEYLSEYVQDEENTNVELPEY